MLSTSAALFYPAAFDAYSVLEGTYSNIDIVGTAFVPTGTVRSFPPSVVPFNTYYDVQGGRWPGIWEVAAVGGCGAGTETDLSVVTKLPNLYCVPREGSMTVRPNSYGITVPDTLVLTFNTAEVPAGSQAQIYFADTAGVYYDEQDVTVDAAGHATVICPDLPKGTHYVIADFVNLPTEYGAQATLTRNCPDQCP
jgi:hypothetical protein